MFTLKIIQNPRLGRHTIGARQRNAQENASNTGKGRLYSRRLLRSLRAHAEMDVGLDKNYEYGTKMLRCRAGKGTCGGILPATGLYFFNIAFLETTGLSTLQGAHYLPATVR